VTEKCINNKRGGQNLVDDINYVYVKAYLKGTKQYWACHWNKSKIKPHCPGSAITAGDVIVKTSAHVHPSYPASI